MMKILNDMKNRNTEPSVDSVSARENEPFLAGMGNMASLKDTAVRIRYAIIIYCTSGNAVIHVNLVSCSLTAGDSMMMLPGGMLMLERSSPDFSVRYLCFSEEIFHDVSFRFEPYFFHYLSQNPRIGSEDVLVSHMLDMADCIYGDRLNILRSEMIRNVVRAYLCDVYDKKYRFFMSDDAFTGERRLEVFKKFMSLVHRHCEKRRDVSFYSDQLCISDKYLTEISKSVFGKSAKRLIDEVLVRKMKYDLLFTAMTLRQISMKYSFPDQSYFGRFFKKETGYSPKRLRQIYNDSGSEAVLNRIMRSERM